MMNITRPPKNRTVMVLRSNPVLLTTSPRRQCENRIWRHAVLKSQREAQDVYPVTLKIRQCDWVVRRRSPNYMMREVRRWHGWSDHCLKLSRSVGTQISQEPPHSERNKELHMQCLWVSDVLYLLLRQEQGVRLWHNSPFAKVYLWKFFRLFTICGGEHFLKWGTSMWYRENISNSSQNSGKFSRMGFRFIIEHPAFIHIEAWIQHIRHYSDIYTRVNFGSKNLSDLEIRGIGGMGAVFISCYFKKTWNR